MAATAGNRCTNALRLDFLLFKARFESLSYAGERLKLKTLHKAVI